MRALRRRLRLILGILGSLVVLAIAAACFVIGPRNLWGMLRYDQRREGTLQVGDPAPDVSVLAHDGTPRTLLASGAKGTQLARPLVLVFGSFT